MNTDQQSKTLQRMNTDQDFHDCIPRDMPSRIPSASLGEPSR
jgi:hypothetical protein